MALKAQNNRKNACTAGLPVPSSAASRLPTSGKERLIQGGLPGWLTSEGAGYAAHVHHVQHTQWFETGSVAVGNITVL